MGQNNLVPNSSFESYSWCPPGGSGSIAHCEGWSNPHGTSTDFHHLCGGRQDLLEGERHQFPRTGDGMAAIYLYVVMDYSEYLGVKLTEPLMADSTYVVRYYVNLDDYMSNATCRNCVEVFFADTMSQLHDMKPWVSGQDDPPYPGHPQIKQDEVLRDSVGWTEVCGSYTAHGGESFLIIGNFRPSDDLDLYGFRTSLDSLTYYDGTYFFIDDVSVIKLEGGRQEQYYHYDLCEDELPLELSARAGYETYVWGEEENDSLQQHTIDQAGVYWVEQGLGCVQMLDAHHVDVETLSEHPDLGLDRYHCEEDRVQTALLDAGPQPNYLWSTGETSRQISVEKAGAYIVTVQYEQCADRRDTVILKGCPPNYDFQLEMPTVFSPNSDGIHDFFVPTILDNLMWERLIIFDRWGRQVYVSEQPYPGWDGRSQGQDLATGVYFYVLHFRHPVHPVPDIERGALTLLR